VLTVCPLANVKLCEFEHIREHNILEMLQAGISIVDNSDDPTCFGGHMRENHFVVVDAQKMTKEQAIQLTINRF
jgi:adenosine deaminase